MPARFAYIALLALLCLPAYALDAQAPLEPPTTGGAVALAHELRMLGHNRRVLMIGAHPDDEDTELLTILVRGKGAEAAYLSLNRGEGGQNLIGPELGEALGLIRTEELLAARRVDGARQFFTRAYDFGFSKTLDDTWAHWPRDSVLKDVVRIVRRFRPQVIVSVFSGTPRDGHGQHQAAGWAAHEAFRIAGDSTRFPELATEEGLPAWSPRKLYRSARFDTAATTLTLEGGVLDPAVGQSLHQIAMASRSRHRSQDMGRLQDLGPSPVRLALVEDRTGQGANALFDGIDTSLAALATDSAVARALHEFAGRVDSVRHVADGAAARRRMVESLGRAAGILNRLAAEQRTREAVAGTSALGVVLHEQSGHLGRALAAAAGVAIDARAEDGRMIPGQQAAWVVEAWNDTIASLGGRLALTEAAEPGTSRRADANGIRRSIGPGAFLSDSIRTPVQARQPETPYFMRQPRQGDLYVWPAQPTRGSGGDARGLPQHLGLPFDGRGVRGALEFGLPIGTDTGWVAIEREATLRVNDQARGEVRRPVVIVPRIDIKVEPDTQVWARGRRDALRLGVVLTHGARDSTPGAVTLELPAGWPAVEPQRFLFTREDERRELVFAVRPPAGAAAGAYEIRAVATDRDGARHVTGLYSVDYPHIRSRSWTSPATAHIVVAPLALPELARIGYVRGAADRIPEALRSVGLPVELLDARALERGDLSRYAAIVVGPRAYETEPALAVNNDRLLAFTRAGGLLIVQYQQYQFVRGGFAPYPLTIASPHDRVTDERAAVHAIDADSPVLVGPNRITEADWQDWVQERGLYFAHDWDAAYQPVLEMRDPGEAPKRGALLVAPLGQGTYVYTGLSFFRQLPAGVPGAYRLFANLLALGAR